LALVIGTSIVTKFKNKFCIYCQGEAFVPESIVRVGMRKSGRDGVERIKADDGRIKCEPIFSCYYYIYLQTFQHQTIRKI
jgi:hypothetical protein